MKKSKNQLTSFLKQWSFANGRHRLFLLTIIYFGFSVNRLIGQCTGSSNADELTYSYYLQNQQAACNNFSGNTSKYNNQSFYVPTANDPLITVKLVIHVFMPSVNTQVPAQINLDQSNDPYRGIPYLQARLNAIQNSTDRFSSQRIANYTVPGFAVNHISDSRLKYEVVAVYYYTNDAVYNGGAYTGMAYIDQNYPARLKEGLPIIYTSLGQFQDVHTSLTHGQIPFVALAHLGAIDPTSSNYNNGFAVIQLRHEIGHALGLMHTYYGDGKEISCTIGNTQNSQVVGWPGNPSKTPENWPLTGGSGCSPQANNNMICTNPDYLTDIFPINNPNCPNICPPNNTSPTHNPPVSSCGSCYENEYMGTNNILSDHGASNGSTWMSPLQMGRRIRNMHLDNHLMVQYAKETVSEHNYPWNITSNEKWDFSIHMYRDIVVKAGNTLTISCKVSMATDGKIIVEKGAKLVIDATGEVTGWCKKTPAGSMNNMPLWAGIEVDGDVYQNQAINNTTGYSANQGIIEIKPGGKVSGAFKGIITGRYWSLYGGFLPTHTGGIVIANGAVFENNVYDIILYKYQLGNPRSKIQNCTFKTSGEIGRYTNNTLIEPKEHIKLYQNWGVKIEGCKFEYTAGNTYALGHRGIGVYTTDSHFTVDKLCSNSGCTNSIRGQFNNLTCGVWCDNFNPLFVGNVKSCDFVNNERGAVVEQMNNMIFTDNNVSMTTNYTGMYLYKSKYYNIRNNNFSSLYWNGAGIVPFDSKDGAHQIYRNTFSGFNVGILAVDHNGGYAGSTPGLKMNCNVFNSGGNNMFDIALTTSLSNMPIVMKQQSNNNTQNANDFVRNLYGATYMTSQTLNKWYVDPSNNQSITHVSTPSGADNPNSPNIQASSQVIVNTSQVNFVYSQNCPANTSSGGGNTTSNSQSLNNLNSYITELRGNSENNYEIQSSVVSKLNIFLTDSTNTGQDSLISILTTNQGNMDDADLQLVFAYLRNANYSTATIKANALGANRSDWKALLLKIIEIEQEEAGVYSLLTNTINTNYLLGYANTNGKDGQGIAQSMLKFVFGTEHDHPLVYPPVPSGQRMAGPTGIEQNIVTHPNIKLFPNPTQAYITVVSAEKFGSDCKLIIQDLLGRTIYSNFISEKTEFAVPMVDFSEGVYILTIMEGKNEILKQKVIKKN
jgi:hypothetical protein